MTDTTTLPSIVHVKASAINPESPYQVMPVLPTVEYALEESMRVTGFDPHHPLLLARVPDDDRLRLLDGHTRYKVARTLGIADLPAIVRTDLDDDEACLKAALEANAFRRQGLNRGQKRELAERLLRHWPALSDRTLAAYAGLSHPTLATIRAELEGQGQIVSPQQRISASGVLQTAARVRQESRRPNVRVDDAAAAFDRIGRAWQTDVEQAVPDRLSGVASPQRRASMLTLAKRMLQWASECVDELA